MQDNYTQKIIQTKDVYTINKSSREIFPQQLEIKTHLNMDLITLKHKCFISFVIFATLSGKKYS